MFLESSQNSQENTSARVLFLIKLQAKASNFIKKDALAQVFSCEFCEISKNNFFTEHLRATTSICSLPKTNSKFHFGFIVWFELDVFHD